MTHTPGPWAVASPITTVSGEPCHIVQAIERSTNGNSIEAFCPGDNREANARLIAASPELLSRLEEVTEILDQCLNAGWFDGGNYGGTRELADQALAVIAKAKGE